MKNPIFDKWSKATVFQGTVTIDRTDIEALPPFGFRPCLPKEEAARIKYMPNCDPLSIFEYDWNCKTPEA
jgi:hypothetical protein